MPPPRLHKKSSKASPPVLSHDFVIENHADILSVVCIIIVCGLLFKVTNPFCSSFVSLQYNITHYNNETGRAISTAFTYGLRDLLTVFFFTLMVIIFRAVEQEYVIDKFIKKTRLSKVKQHKYVESCNLFVFYIVSVAYGVDILTKERWVLNDSIHGLYKDYPHTEMSFAVKMFYLLQFAFWLHNFCELYLLKAKKEEITPRVIFYSLNLIFTEAAYILNFSRLGLVCILGHYVVQIVFHASRLLVYFGKVKQGSSGLTVWSYLYPFIRFDTVALCGWIFLFALPGEESALTSTGQGNFNQPIVRYAAIGCISALQIYMLMKFYAVISKYTRDQKEAEAASSRSKQIRKKSKKNKDSKKDADSGNEKDEEPVATGHKKKD
ncbi:Translocating chain-associated membrane protein 1-like 1 [Trichoplax sp. H2]|nr:Translocating chain-associated membrane protein 1-like 1 [Trichoplax sp. H2]|eukprot:RDD42117.1 Translocating chain-associated membrane protein 1-like 1 [Trichoplax sp. H2]